MSTQTGSISFEAAGGFNSYAKQNYATLSQIKGQFATCGTGASTAAKVATIVPTDSGWTLYDGATITVKFTSKNTAENPTLNVNGTGAKPIKDYAGNDLTQVVREWPEGAAMALTYDGSSWRIQDSSLMERVHTAETSIEQTATSITSLATLEDTYIKPDGTTETNSIKSQFKQTADSIDAKVDKNGVIASINASVEEENGSQIKISADKVNIEGAAIFSSGRLSTTSLNDTYDAKGAASTVNNTLTDYMSTTNSTLQSLQNQVDGQIEAWFFETDPATTSYAATATPTDSAASTWTTAEIKERHIGDLYYNTTDGHSWRWMKDGNNYKWLAIPDSDAAAALAKANAAQATANSKRRIFTTQPTTPYDKGDLWVNGDAVKYCGTARASGNYNASDWVLTATDDTLAQSAKDIANAANATEQTLYYASNSTTVPAIPTAQIITNSATIYGAWNLALPTYSATYPYLYTCLQRKTAGGMYSWTGAMQSSYAAWTSTINTTANNAAPKNSAISRTQRIYYRQTANGAKPGINETWLATSGTGYGNWSLTIPQLTSGTTKYPKLYTAVQTQTVAQQANNGTTCSCSPVQLDDSTTVIDGGNIITGSVTANQIASNTITANEIDATNLHINAANIDGTITFGQLSGVQAAGNYATTTELTTETNQRKAQYGTCDTTAATQAKVVTCANFELVAGNELTVKFSTANTYASGAVQLNVNSKGAKNVWVGNAITSTTNKLLWGAGAYITFRYDGTQFIVIGEPRTWYGACNTAEGTAAKTDTTAVTGCVICKGTKVELAMTNANTADAPTLNIQSTGALAIYFGNGTVRPTKAGGTSWLATNTCTFTFDGATWRTQGKTYIDANSIITGYISADRINAGSIGVNKIDASSGTFNTANIPELSAAKITSGDIAADRIKANAVSAINATANKIDAKNINVSEINIGDLAGEIGGRNLLIGNAGKPGKWTVAAPSGASFIKTEFDNGYHVNISFNSVSGYENLNAPAITVEIGKQYTLSCKYSVNKEFTETSGKDGYGITVRTDEGNHGSYDTTSNSLGKCKFETAIGTYASSFTFTPTTDTIYLCLNGGQIADNQTGLSFDIYDVQLEKGNKPTDWTPAPEDVDSAIDDASKVASNYIHADSTGIRIASANPLTATTCQHQTASATEFYISNKKRSQVDANGLEIFDTDGSTSLAKFGSELRVGKTASPRVEVIPNSGVYVFGGTIELYAGNNTSTSQKTSISSSGVFNYYNSNNYTKQASDGFYVYEGGSLRTKIGSGTIDLYAGAQTYPKTSLSSSGVFNYYDSTHYSKIDSSGLTVYSGDASKDVASFGSTARIGKTDSSRFLMNANSLQAYDSNNTKYFEVDANGLKFGNSIAASKEYVDAIEVGGRNLLKNSASLMNSWVKQNATVANDIATITKAASGDSRIYQMPASGYWSWTKGETYTISVDAKSESSGCSVRFVGAGTGAIDKVIEVTSDWHRYSYTFTVANSGATDPCSLYVNGATGTVLSVRKPKLEKGNRATDWTPAPEDVDADVTAAINTAANDAKKYATNYIALDPVNGIRIADANPDTATTYQRQTSTSTEFVVNGESMLKVGGDGQRIGKAYVQGANGNESHMELDYHSLQMVDMSNVKYLHISDLRNKEARYTATETLIIKNNHPLYGHASAMAGIEPLYLLSVTYSHNGTEVKDDLSLWDTPNGSREYNLLRNQAFDSDTKPDNNQVTFSYVTNNENAKAFSFGIRDNTRLGGLSLVAGYDNRAGGLTSAAFGTFSVADGAYSFAEGIGSQALGDASHAEGSGCVSSGDCSHSEGVGTMATPGLYTMSNWCLPDEVFANTDIIGAAAHSEGQESQALGHASHAEGEGTVARKAFSHAAGYMTQANGACSTAIGNRTIAAGQDQVVIGHANVANGLGHWNGGFAFIVGNGITEANRSNAAVIDWLGNYIAQGWAGITQMFAGTVTQTVDSDGVATATGAPAGWLLCDGSAVSRTIYSTLFTAIGTTWGAGDGSTTFNLPDLRGRTVVGVDPNGSTNSYDESSNMLLTDSAKITQEQYLAYVLKLSGRSLAANTRYTLQLFDVHISHSGKTETTIGLGIFWGGGGSVNHLATVYASPDNDGETTLKSYTSNGNVYAYCKHLTVTLDTTGKTQADNVLWIYNSPNEVSGTKLVEIGRWMLNAEADGALPWEPRRWFHRYGAYDLGMSGGIDHPDIQTVHMPSHTHNKGTLAITASGSHNHDVKGYGDYVAKGTNYYRYGSGGSKTASIGMSNETHTHPNANFTGNTGSAGGNNSFDVRSAYAVVNYIIHTGKTS